MSDEQKGFTVKDRRHFTNEGDARSGDEAPPAATRPSAVADAPAAQAPETPDETPSARRPVFPTDLTGLFVSLAAQGSMLLSQGNEGGGPDPESCRAVITLLEVLGEKTQGRLTPQEERLLGQILYELRMGYVAVSEGRS